MVAEMNAGTGRLVVEALDSAHAGVLPAVVAAREIAANQAAKSAAPDMPSAPS